MSNRLNFTKAALDALPLPAAGQRASYHDEGGPQSVPGLTLRITSSGAQSFCVFKRSARGRPERITIGRYPEISIDQARKLAKRHIAELAQGHSPSETKRQDRERGMTLTEAMAEYVAEKRRRDGLPLKERTSRDYMLMLAPGRVTLTGRKTVGGMLCTLANKPIREITAEDIRKLHASNQPRGERQAGYAMQVLRAVLNWHGVQVPHSPFSRETHGRDRIMIAPARAAGLVLTPEQIGPWWQALPASTEGDFFRLLLLTGVRPGEAKKLRVADCDMTGGRVLLKDTKNRKDHRVLLSRQAMTIVKKHVKGKEAEDSLFGLDQNHVFIATQTLAEVTGIAVTPKTLRATFASIAEGLVSAYCLKTMMNHANSGDITGIHYVHKGEGELRAGWQKVADFIEAQAADNVVPIRGGAA